MFFVFIFEELASVIETYTRDIFFLQSTDRSLLIDSSQEDGIIVMYSAEQFQPIVL